MSKKKGVILRPTDVGILLVTTGITPWHFTAHPVQTRLILSNFLWLCWPDCCKIACSKLTRHAHARDIQYARGCDTRGSFSALSSVVFHMIPFTCPLGKLKNVNPALHIIQKKASEKPFLVALCCTEYGGSLFF